MAEEPFSGLNNEAIKRAQTIRFELGEIEASFKRINKSSTENKDTLKSLETTFGNIGRSVDKVADLQEQAKSSTKGTADALKEQTKQLNIVRNLNEQIDILYEKSTYENGKINSSILKQAKNLSEARDKAKELAGIFGDIAEDSSKLDKSTIFFSKIAEVVKDIPGLRKFSSPFEAAAKATRQQVLDNAKIEANQESIAKLTNNQLKTGRGLNAEKLKELGLSEITQGKTNKAAADLLRIYQATSKTSTSMMAGLNAGMKSAGESFSSFFKGGGWIGALIAGAITLFKFIKDAMLAADTRVTSIAKNLSISKDAAADVYSNLTNLKGSLDTIYGTTSNIVEAFNQVSTATGFIGVATKDQVETQIILTKNLGLQVEEANQLQGLFAANNTEASKGVDIVYDQVAAFANENKLLASGAQTLKEIQNTSKLILVNFRGNIPTLTNAILEAKKLGLSLDQVNKVAGSLLNFEESISAELEAELLLGRDINLERARLFALNNDIAGVTKEIAAQGITIESFSRMNRIQQEAIAKTLGMQAEELGKALYDAKVIETLGTRDLEVKRKLLKEQREIALAKGDEKKLATAINDEARIAAIDKQMLTGKTLQEAEKSVSVQEKFNILIERAKEIFSDIFTGEMLDKFADSIEALVKALESGRSLLSIMGLGVGQEMREVKLQNTLYEKAQKEGYVGDKKEFLKSDEYTGMKKQRVDEAWEKYGLGSAHHAQATNVKGMAYGGIVTRPTRALIGEAGQSEAVVPLNEFYAKIDQLIQVQQNVLLATREGKNIYLDSNKLGTAQNMATTKLS
jgi:hypothetical protein